MRSGRRISNPLELLLLLAPFCIGLFHVWMSAAASLALLAGICIGAKQHGGRRLRLPQRGLAFPALALLPVMFLPGLFFGVDKGQALFGFVKFLPLPLFALALLQQEEAGRARLWCVVPLGGVCMTLLSGVLQFVPALKDFFQVNGRLSGFFQYPNTFAAYLLCGCMGLFWFAELPAYQRVSGFLVLAAGIFASGSRTTLACLGLFVVIHLVVCRESKRSRELKHEQKVECAAVSAAPLVAAAVAAAAAFLLILAAVWGNTELLRRFLVLPTKSSTFLGRLLYAQDVLPVIFTHPLGLGYQGYLYQQGSFQTGVYQTRFVHNELLQVLVDVGWLPAGLLVAAVVQAFRCGDLRRRAALILLLGHALFDFDFQFPVMGFFFVLLLELKASGKCIRKRDAHAAAAVGVALCVVCLYIGAVDLTAYCKAYAWTLRLYPAHTQSLLALLETAEEREREDIADRILAGNQCAAKAWQAKAAAAFSRGDAEDMIRWQREAIRLDKYSIVEYEQYFDWIYLYMQLYLQEGITESAVYCRELLLEIPALLAETEEGTSELGRRIYDKPELELSKEYQDKIRALQSGW